MVLHMHSMSYPNQSNTEHYRRFTHTPYSIKLPTMVADMVPGLLFKAILGHSSHNLDLTVEQVFACSYLAPGTQKQLQ